MPVLKKIVPDDNVVFPMVKEETEEYMKHDRLFKQLIGMFFEDFLKAFFPEIYEQIDFERITPLSEEIFVDSHNSNKKIVDLAIEVKWKDTNTLFIVHIESQGSRQSNFNKRMFEYFSLLYNKFNKLIVPIAVFTYDDPWEEQVFSIQFLNYELLRFEYFSLHLKKQNWREFIKKDNPVAAALLSKMGFSEDEKIQVKLEFAKIFTRLNLNVEKKSFLLGFFNHYMRLNEEEEERYVKEAKKLDNAEEILELPVSYLEQGKIIGKEEGKEEGREEGREDAQKQFVLSLHAEGFTVQKIMKLTKLAEDRVVNILERQ